jgi:hypothetical protein
MQNLLLDLDSIRTSTPLIGLFEVSRDAVTGS